MKDNYFGPFLNLDGSFHFNSVSDGKLAAPGILQVEAKRFQFPGYDGPEEGGGGMLTWRPAQKLDSHTDAAPALEDVAH